MELCMKPIRTWIVVADGAFARVFESLGASQRLVPIEAMTMSGDHRASHEILADRPGRTNESVGPTRHAIEPSTDPHRSLKRTFAEHVVHTLASRLADKSFDRFVLVAPPKTLGDLRGALTPALRSVLHAEVAKDLIKTPQNEIITHLTDVVGI
jgi:protein required for attachment to host cells